MNKLYFLFTFIFMSLSILHLKAEENAPVITIKTLLAENDTFGITLLYAEPAEELLSTDILIDFGRGPQEYSIDNQRLTYIQDILGEGGTVRIYGKTTDLAVIRFEEPLKITDLDVTKNERLKNLYCRGQRLESLNLTQNHELTDLDASQNSLKGLIDISNNKKLVNLVLFENYNLTGELDMTEHEDLVNLDIRRCNYTSLNLSNNPKLEILEIRGNELLPIPDLTYNTKLTALVAGNSILDAIDVTKNPDLIYLEIYEGNLEEIDLSNNTALYRIVLTNHKLTTLDLTNNINLMVADLKNNELVEISGIPESLVYLQIDKNCFNFATLPWFEGSYSFSNQKCAIPINNDMRIEGYGVDLSAQTRGEYETLFTWKTINNQTLEQGIDYTVKDGISSFHILPETEVYCEIMHELFEYLILKTDPIKITGVTENTRIGSIESDFLTIKGVQQNILINSDLWAEVTIYNLSGKTIYTGWITEGENQISLINSGIYIVKVTDNDKSVISKVALQ